MVFKKKGEMSRRRFLEGAAAVAASLTVSGDSSETKKQLSEEEHADVTKQITPEDKLENIETNVDEVEVEKQMEYADYFKEYPNLSLVAERLQQSRITTQEGNEISGMEAVLQILENGYDPGQSIDELKELIEKYIDNSPHAIYALRVAHSLWVEHNNAVPWSIKDYTEDQIGQMYFVPVYDTKTAPNGAPDMNTTDNQSYRPRIPLDDSTLKWDAYAYGMSLQLESNDMQKDGSYQFFPLAHKFLADDHVETTKNILRFLKSEFFHAGTQQDGTEWGWKLYQDGRKGFKGQRIWKPTGVDRLFEERISGCGTQSFLNSSLHRSLNIPAMEMRILEDGHRSVYLGSEDRYVHGDQLFSPAAPVEWSLLAKEQFEEAAVDGGRHLSTLSETAEKEGFNKVIANSKIERVGNDLILKVYGQYSEKEFAHMQKEVPAEFKMTRTEQGYIKSETVKLKTLEELRK